MDWIVIVDDDFDNLTRVSSILAKEGMKTTTLSSGIRLIDYLEGMTPLPDLILMDVIMPEKSGLETLSEIRNRYGESFNVPVIFLTGDEDLSTEMKGLNLGAADFVRKPFYPETLILRIRKTIELSRLQRTLAKEVDNKTKENTRLTLHVVQTLAKAIDAKDTYTNGHSDRVANYSREIAKRLGYSEKEQDEMYMIGLLHDVGKIGVPDQIINKTDRLTDEEFEEIKKHPTTGHKILKTIKEMPQLAYGARWHHERIDGRGYPDGLKGNEIPEEARIIAVADAYDAMTSNRSYRKVMPQATVREEIIKGKGKQFDENIADIMIDMIDSDTEYTMREITKEENISAKYSAEETVNRIDVNPELPIQLSEIEMIDTNLGLFLCGDIEDYLEALSIFNDSIETKSNKIEEALAARDIETYTTLVHSLKSSSRTIGAVDISNLAKALEKAGKDKDIETIISETPNLLAMYRDLGNPLSSIIPK